MLQGVKGQKATVVFFRCYVKTGSHGVGGGSL